MGEEIVAGGLVVDDPHVELERAIVNTARLVSADRLYIHDLAAVGASLHNVPLSKVLSPCRERGPSEVRAAVYLVLRGRGWGLQRIGDAFERDHSTVWHQLVRAERLARVTADYAHLVMALEDAALLANPVTYLSDAGPGYRILAQLRELETAIAHANALRGEMLASLRSPLTPSMGITRRREAVA